jgi:type IV pilus biogenesis protein CpaD/CtpE
MFKHRRIVLAAAILASVSACSITDTTSTTSDSIDTVTPDVTLNRFVDVRIASIKQEAAAGEGENLEALAKLMGKTDAGAFSGWMQAHYDELFVGLDQPSELISRIESISGSTRS